MQDLISLRTIKSIFLSLLSSRPLNNLLYAIHFGLLYSLAQICTLDLYELNFESKITQLSLGARFLTRLFQIYLLKSSIRRFMDILGYEQIGVAHFVLVLLGVFSPIIITGHPLLVYALILIPGHKSNLISDLFKTSSSLRYY